MILPIESGHLRRAALKITKNKMQVESHFSNLHFICFNYQI